MSFNYDISDEVTIQTNLIQLNYYIIGLGGFLMFCIGIITNIINLIVFSRRAMKTTTNKYLTALAICDIFVLIFSQLITSNSFISNYNKTANSFDAFNFELKAHPGDHLFSADSSNDSANHFKLNNSTTVSPSTDTDISYLSHLYYNWSLNIYNRIYPCK